MRILAIAHIIPMRDRSAGWFRFYHLLRILASEHELHLHPVALEWQREYYGEEAVADYRSELEELGVHITGGKWDDAAQLLRTRRTDIVLFEHYSTAKRILDRVRYWQPQAKIIVDSVDVAFNRLFSKAMLTKNPDDLRLAQKVKTAELSAYARSDFVIGISHSDRALLEKEDPALRVEVIPLIYAVPPFERANRAPSRNLVYVAHFEHDANVDGIVHFCENVLPLILKDLPDIRLRIVGHSPPEAVTRLAGPNVEVLGFVSDIRAVYESSDVAIAPMRFGGGLKGKIAEAMSYGLPVVTNSVCLEGFALLPGKDVLVGDNPADFARAVVEVLRDTNLYEAIRERGWNHIRTHFSEDVIARMLREVLDRSQQFPAKKLPKGKWVRWKARDVLARHVLWRFKGNAVRAAH